MLQRQSRGCTRDALEQFCRRSLQPTDRVALEATTNTWAVVEILKPFVAEVVVSNPLKTKARQTRFKCRETRGVASGREVTSRPVSV